MKGGTLLVSSAVNNYHFFKEKLEGLGYPDVTTTNLKKDALHNLIKELKPGILLMGARFYQCSTPYMMKELANDFPAINMAAVTLDEYPPDLAMYFIINGVKSYVTMFDGVDQWLTGLDYIRNGKIYISPSVKQRIEKRTVYPKPAVGITDRQKEVILLTCNGFKETEISDTLHISRRTVDTHKRELFTSLNIRNSNDLIRAALNLEMVKLDEMFFYPNDFVLKPLPDTKTNKRRSK